MERFIIDPVLLDYPIDILDAPHRVMVRLRAKGVERLADLEDLSDGDLLSIYHFGKKSLEGILQRLEMLNLCAKEHGGPPEQLLECMRLKLSKSEEVIEKIVHAVVDEATTRESLSYHLSQLSPRSVFVVSERIGLRRDQIRTLQELADMMKLTRERVRQLQNRTFEHLKDVLYESGVLGRWEKILSQSAAEPPHGEPFFLERIGNHVIVGRTSAPGFVVLATHLIKGTDLNLLLKAYRDGRLSRFWIRKNRI